MSKIVEQRVQNVMEVPSVLDDTIKHIEWVAKICYQSHDNMKPGSAEKMVASLIHKEHMAMIEHSWCVFKTAPLTSSTIANVLEKIESFIAQHDFIYYDIKDRRVYIMGNYRAFMESDLNPSWSPLAHGLNSLRCAIQSDFSLPELQYELDPPKEFRAYTAVLKTDRAVTHELVRHRPASYAQESQRYVRYDGKMEFIRPSWFKYEPFENYSELGDAEKVFIDSCIKSEKEYKKLRELGLKAQDARVVLPNSTATQIAVTAPIWEWDHIFKLRCSKAAYPQIRVLMNETRRRIKEIEQS